MLMPSRVNPIGSFLDILFSEFQLFTRRCALFRLGGGLAFDASTTLALNFKSIIAAVVAPANICDSSGALTWALLTYRETGKWSPDSTFVGDNRRLGYDHT